MRSASTVWARYQPWNTVSMDTVYKSGMVIRVSAANREEKRQDAKPGDHQKSDHVSRPPSSGLWQSTMTAQTKQESVQQNSEKNSEVIHWRSASTKEVRNYQESLFFGLSLRQLLFALLAVAVAVGVYFGLRPVLGNGEIGWVCVLQPFPLPRAAFSV